MIRDRKTLPGLNHLEQNVYDGLQDIPTIVELIPLAANAVAVSQIYMARVHSFPSSNGLDLGPWHEKVKAHVHHLKENPSLFLKPGVTAMELCLDGRPMQCPDVLLALQHEAADLPTEDVIGAITAFFAGAEEGWIRFSEEYAPEGRVASLTPAQRDCAFMPMTNDANEGALEHYWLMMRQKPLTLALQLDDALQTELHVGVMKRHFGVKGHAYLRQRARIRIKEKHARAAKKLLKRAQEMAGVVVELDPTRIQEMSSNDLCKQLVLWHERVFTKKEIPVASKCTKKLTASQLACKLSSASRTRTCRQICFRTQQL